MASYVMKGGNPLSGEVHISGAKNAALGILAACVMTDEDVIIRNLPDVSDTNALLEAIKEIGATVDRTDSNTVRINAGTIDTVVVDNDPIRKIRAGYYLIGSLLGRYGSAQVPLPGGCEIGRRPIDQHIKGFKALNATVDVENGFVKARSDRLAGSHIYLDKVSVGATINVMLAAVLAADRTIIENVAKEPHVVDVANFLNSMGADIRGAGTDVIRIRGVERLHGTDYSIIPDQIEAGTFMCAAAITRGDITIGNIIPKHMEAISAKLHEIGCELIEFDDAIRVVGRNDQRATHVMTLPYPGFPTDMQPQLTSVLTLARGTSMVVESIFENRFRYTDELAKMSADIMVEANTAIVRGVDNLTGARMSAPDLRAGAALVLAGLAAKGCSIVDDVEYIERGYEHFIQKLRLLGAQIDEADDEAAVKNLRQKM